MIVGPHREHTPLHSTIVEDRDENGEGDGEPMTGEFLVTKERQKNSWKSLDGSFLPSQEMNNEVKRWKSKTEQQLMDISSSLSSMQKVAIELSVEHGVTPGSRSEKSMLANECDPLTYLAPNIERLKSDAEDYVLKHGNSLNKKCHSCFPSREHLKVGSGATCFMESHRSTGHVMEAIIIISESSEPLSPCVRAFGQKTELRLEKLWVDFEERFGSRCPCIIGMGEPATICTYCYCPPLLPQRGHNTTSKAKISI